MYWSSHLSSCKRKSFNAQTLNKTSIYDNTTWYYAPIHNWRPKLSPHWSVQTMLNLQLSHKYFFLLKVNIVPKWYIYCDNTKVKGVLHPWALFLKTLCIFSKNKATSDKVSHGSGQKCSKELKNHNFTLVGTIVVKLQCKMCENQYFPCFEP